MVVEAISLATSPALEATHAVGENGDAWKSVTNCTESIIVLAHPTGVRQCGESVAWVACVPVATPLGAFGGVARGDGSLPGLYDKGSRGWSERNGARAVHFAPERTGP